MIDLLLATRSGGKIREIRELTADGPVRWHGLDEFPGLPDAPETGATFLENATQKSLYYGNATGRPALADDSGLEVDALGGRPGVDSAYFAGHPRDDGRNNAHLVALLRDIPEERRAAHFRCVMVFSEGGRVICSTEGSIAGRIIDVPRGSNGFGYDPHFLVPSLGCTTAELPSARKNAISHRGIALRAMLEKIAEWAQSRASVAS
jgi:XTP/dITP diphosphohydrolase